MDFRHIVVICVSSPTYLDDNYSISWKIIFCQNPCGTPQGSENAKNFLRCFIELFVLFYPGWSSNFFQTEIFINEGAWKVSEVVFLWACAPWRPIFRPFFWMLPVLLNLEFYMIRCSSKSSTRWDKNIFGVGINKNTTRKKSIFFYLNFSWFLTIRTI